MIKNIKAITLISLVITIVVLIILASVAIYLSLGDNGIFTRASEAREATNKQTATEKINLKITTAQMNKYAEKQEMPTLKELSEVLRYDNEIEYVLEESRNKIASEESEYSAEYNVPSKEPSSIYTKLNDYPYEFEINSQLQLASIDGVKIATQIESKVNPTTILYPRGTAETPGIINSNERIEIQNPYPGHILYLLVQIKIDGLWCETGYIYSDTYNGAYGVKATQLEGENKDLIVIQSGKNQLIPSTSAASGNGFNISEIVNSAQFRLKVVCLD